MQTTIGDVKNYLNQKITSMAWQRIQMRLLPEFNKRGIFLHAITDSMQIDRDLMAAINTAVNTLYNESLPSEFLN
ncbi:hypothetical protein JMN32_16915 [Fulvivirga sp. 29W222]|uniref:Uncharacterized protein n=1 Tax=Fulvivirga marina TaxID=2494733 RepID=A0A937G3Z1_9BACT|nr:hypothetical protein [Fulvivirga marina]MBL6448001.1 hypothetical protein [Fulvivirga marina]